MKKLLIIITVLITTLSQAQGVFDYTMYEKYTTAKKLDIDVSDTTLVYKVYDTDLQKFQIHFGAGWVDVGGSGGSQTLDQTLALGSESTENLFLTNGGLFRSYFLGSAGTTYTEINGLRLLTTGANGNGEVGQGYVSAFSASNNNFVQLNATDGRINMRGGFGSTGYIEVENYAGEYVWRMPLASTRLLGMSSIVDDDTFANANAWTIPSTESVKNYVDANSGGLENPATTNLDMDSNDINNVGRLQSQSVALGDVILTGLINFPSTGTKNVNFRAMEGIVAYLSDLPNVIDDDTFAIATSTNIPSAESVQAYVDANSGGITAGKIGDTPVAVTQLLFQGDDVTFSEENGVGTVSINTPSNLITPKFPTAQDTLITSDLDQLIWHRNVVADTLVSVITEELNDSLSIGSIFQFARIDSTKVHKVVFVGDSLNTYSDHVISSDRRIDERLFSLQKIGEFEYRALGEFKLYDYIAPASNLILNSTFDDSSNVTISTDWSITGGVAVYTHGDGSKTVDWDLSENMVAGNSYNFTLDILNLVSGDARFQILVNQGGSWVQIFSNTNYNSGVDVNITAPAGADSTQIRILTSSVASSFDIDNASLTLN